MSRDILENKDKEVIAMLRNIGYTGMFPGTEALLVSISIALQESLVIDNTLTIARLESLLKRYNILVFSTLENYVRYLGKRKTKNV